MKKLSKLDKLAHNVRNENDFLKCIKYAFQLGSNKKVTLKEVIKAFDKR